MRTVGEHQLRAMFPKDSAFNTTCRYDAISNQWLVTVKFFPEDQPAFVLHEEPLSEFPSEYLKAQLMLVCS